MDFRKRSGCFTSTGEDYLISGISPFSSITVLNYTQAAATGADQGFKFVYYRGMEDGGGVVYLKGAGGGGGAPSKVMRAAGTAGPVSVNTMDGTGFTIINTGQDALGPEISVTAISTAEPPVATNTGTNGLVAGSVVQFINVEGAPQIAGIPFTVGNNTLSATTFSIDYLPKLDAAGTTAKARVLLRGRNDNPKVFYITAIEKGETTKVKFSETINLKKGVQGRFQILDDVFGMSEINGRKACVIDVDTDPKTGNTITVDIDSRNFKDFTFPKAADTKFTPAQFIPLGTCQGKDDLCCGNPPGLFTNSAAIGVLLKAGKTSPAGQKGDKIYWEMCGNDLGCWGKEL